MLKKFTISSSAPREHAVTRFHHRSEVFTALQDCEIKMENGLINRYKIMQVTINRELSIKTLQMQRQSMGLKCLCHLSGSWFSSPIERNDYVYVRGPIGDDGSFIIDDDNGLIILKPDVMIPVGSLSSSLTCLRKSWLNRIFGSKTDPGSKIYSIMGMIVHDVFQIACLKGPKTIQELEAIHSICLNRDKIKKECEKLGLEGSKELIAKHVTPYLPSILEFLETLETVKGGPKIQVIDIEDSLWCQLLALVGRPDLTCKILPRTRSQTRPKFAPLELKTGTSSRFNSREHKLQTILYTIMMKELGYGDCDEGLILYLKKRVSGKPLFQPEMVSVQVDRNMEMEAIQKRNELVHFLDLNRREGLKGPQLINSKEIDKCKYCKQSLTCSIVASSLENRDIGSLDKDRKEFIRSQFKMNNITVPNLVSFKREILPIADKIKRIDSSMDESILFWEETSFQREMKGLGLGGLVIIKVITPDNVFSSTIILKKPYSPSPNAGFHQLFPQIGRSLKGKRVAISEDNFECETETARVALLTGFITSVDESEVKVELPKIVNNPKDTIYRLDLLGNRDEKFLELQSCFSKFFESPSSVSR
ncbi:DNA replication ATP-dependent helicase/nuclease DNA2-like [Brevipalpus obovatus]|uniref:DNA replication ATP-dependent helicase/nuclease DNA2-like n=1 Tax=Brevipalpus obovatus TaxID=246614 RepID=UPI003D9EEABE